MYIGAGAYFSQQGEKMYIGAGEVSEQTVRKATTASGILFGAVFGGVVGFVAGIAFAQNQ